MKIKILNVIEVVDGSVLSVNSFMTNVFPIDLKNMSNLLGNKPLEDVTEQSIVTEAEQLFIAKAKKNGLGDNDVDFHLEEGSFKNDNYSVFLTWSE